MPVIACHCGAKLRISDQQARQGIKCPKCEKSIRVRSKPATAAAKVPAQNPSPAQDPIEEDDWASSDDDPLGLGDVASAEGAANPLTANQPTPSAPVPTQPVLQNSQPQFQAAQPVSGHVASTATAKAGKSWGAGFQDQSFENSPRIESFGTLELVTGIVGLIHSSIFIGSIVFSMLGSLTLFGGLASMHRTNVAVLGPWEGHASQPLMAQGAAFGLLLGLVMLVFLFAIFAANVGIAVASIGLLCRAPWSKKVGYYSGVVCVGFFALGFGLMVISTISSIGSLGAGSILGLFWYLLYTAVFLAAPILMIVVYMRSEKQAGRRL